MDPSDRLKRAWERRQKERAAIDRDRDDLARIHEKMVLERQKIEWEQQQIYEQKKYRDAMVRAEFLKQEEARRAAREAERQRLVKASKDAHSYMTGLEDAQALIDSLTQKVA